MNTNITILYAERHKHLISKLKSLLNRFALFIDKSDDDILGSSIDYWTNYMAEYSLLLRRVDAVILFCSEDQFFIDSFRVKITNLINSAKERDKQIFLVTDHIYVNMLRFLGRTDIEKKAQELFQNVSVIELQDGWSEYSIPRVAARVYNELNSSNEKNILYDKLLDFQRLGYSLGILDVLSELLIVLSNEITTYPFENEARKSIYKELYRLILMMYQKSDGEFSGEGRTVAHKQLSAITEVEKLLSEQEFLTGDIYYSALAITLIYLISFIRHDCVEWITHDDVHLLLETNQREARANMQEPFYSVILEAQEKENYSLLLEESYTSSEIEVIKNVDNNLISNLVSDGHSVYRLVNGVFTEPVVIPKIAVTSEVSEEDKMLESIAELIRKSLEIFDKFSDKEKALELLRLLKTSYERLKNYCMIVDSKRVAAECITYISEISNRIEQYTIEESAASKVEDGLRSLLGLKLPEQGEYDVFLSYKHEDKDIVTKCYRFFKEHHIYPFLDFEALPMLSNSDYEEAIMEALDKSRHFVLILTDLEFLKSYWVQLEMKTFEHEMAEGRKPDSNLILLVSDSVYNSIIETNKKCLPIRFRAFEIFKISNYRNAILPYIEK